jgi:hypothetical protein
MKISRGNLSEFLFLSAFLVFLIIPQSALADTISTNNIDLTCTYPGRIVEAGETVIFDQI